METYLKVEEYQQHIPLFLSNHLSGYVHSVFQNGLNISMGNRLFFIGTTNYGRNPFGIHLSQEAIHRLVSKVAKESSVQWDTGQKRLIFKPSQVVVDLTEANEFEDKLQPMEIKPKDIPQFDTFVTELVLNEEPTGLGIDIEQFLLDYGTNKHSQQSAVKSIYTLMDGLLSKEEVAMEDVVRFFLGRGKGLTPSGDDHLVGLLAMDAITGAFDPKFSDTLKSLITNETLTTDVGQEYIQYALKGYFSSDIVQVTRDLFDENRNVDMHAHMLKLLQLGHSSGVDTAFGMLIGMLALRRKRIWEKK